MKLLDARARLSDLWLRLIKEQLSHLVQVHALADGPTSADSIHLNVAEIPLCLRAEQTNCTFFTTEAKHASVHDTYNTLCRTNAKIHDAAGLLTF